MALQEGAAKKISVEEAVARRQELLCQARQHRSTGMRFIRVSRGKGGGGGWAVK